MKYVRITIGILILIFVAFMTWFKITFSMDVAPTREYHPVESNHAILIATQGSAFKDTIVHEIVAAYRADNYIKVTDIEKLYGVDETAWDCIVIVHTWEMWMPPKAIKYYMKRRTNPNKHVVITTSGDGHYKQDNVDAITTASIMEDSHEIAEQAIQKMNKILTP